MLEIVPPLNEIRLESTMVVVQSVFVLTLVAIASVVIFPIKQKKSWFCCNNNARFSISERAHRCDEHSIISVEMILAVSEIFCCAVSDISFCAVGGNVRNNSAYKRCSVLLGASER